MYYIISLKIKADILSKMLYFKTNFYHFIKRDTSLSPDNILCLSIYPGVEGKLFSGSAGGPVGTGETVHGSTMLCLRRVRTCLREMWNRRTGRDVCREKADLHNAYRIYNLHQLFQSPSWYAISFQSPRQLKEVHLVQSERIFPFSKIMMNTARKQERK